MRGLALGLSAVLLAGCGGGSTPSTSPPTSVVTTTSARTVGTDGTDGTAARGGPVLALGKRAVVRWRAGKAHDSRVALAVTAVRRGTISDLRQFILNDAARSSNVYYVTAVVRNIGGGNLSGQLLTLYGQVSKDLVVPPVTFGSTFDRCAYQPLPDGFTRGAKAHVCIVMLAPKHGSISTVQWRGSGQTEPISWRVH